MLMYGLRDVGFIKTFLDKQYQIDVHIHMLYINFRQTKLNWATHPNVSVHFIGKKHTNLTLQDVWCLGHFFFSHQAERHPYVWCQCFDKPYQHDRSTFDGYKLETCYRWIIIIILRVAVRGAFPQKMRYFNQEHFLTCLKMFWIDVVCTHAILRLKWCTEKSFCDSF